MTVGGGILYSDHQPLLYLHNHWHGIRKFIVGHIFSYCYFHSPLLTSQSSSWTRETIDVIQRYGGTSAKTGFVIHSSSEARKGEGQESHLVDIELWTDFQSILWIYIYDTLLMTGRLPFRPTSFSGEPEWRKLDRRRGWYPACLWLIVFRGWCDGREEDWPEGKPANDWD